eukprot:NODE_337_length_1865_cov_5935.724670_g243_i0.p1 GENE.NODE_337_length_1865_cov_5935.724670_g243_i0~~NODE_337_length_1865_cov_5935.724670_g243_i0.p1  ORF type:complete len:524 (+),score=-78.80 NODE_337_length_1865_cov_5935.724670_g243_i0:183-1754(+)
MTITSTYVASLIIASLSIICLQGSSSQSGSQLNLWNTSSYLLILLPFAFVKSSVLLLPCVMTGILASMCLVYVNSSMFSVIVPIHYILLLVCIYSMESSDLLPIVLIDLLSLLQACIVLTPVSSPYLLFQIFTSVVLWSSIINSSSYWLLIGLYAKLGISIGAQFLPALYRTISLYSPSVLAYIGSANLTMMLYLNTLASSGNTLLCGVGAEYTGVFTMIVILSTAVLPLVWIFSGHLYSNILPYVLGLSTTLYATMCFYCTLSVSGGEWVPGVGSSLHGFIVSGILTWSILVYTLTVSLSVQPTTTHYVTSFKEPGMVSGGASMSVACASGVQLVQTTRSDYGGRNATLCPMFPSLVMLTITYVCYICHTCHLIGGVTLLLVAGWLLMIATFLQVTILETRLLATNLSRSSSQAAFSWLILLELSFFFGAIWSLSIALTHPSPLYPSLTSASIAVEHSTLSTSHLTDSIVDTCVTTTSPFLSGKQSETLHLAYTSLCILLAVTLILQLAHRLLQINNSINVA